MDKRRILAAEFAKCHGFSGELVTFTGDASTRRYFRTRGAVVMDAPNQAASLRAFVDIGAHLQSLGLSAPDIYAFDLEAGFIVLEDLGDDLFASLTAASPDREAGLYEAATDVLVKLHNAPLPALIKPFSVQRMCDQASIIFDWYTVGDKETLIALLNEVLATLAGERQPMLLRDYHAENMIWLPNRSGLAKVGLLDFQDAMYGLPGYDLVSMLMDARRDVSPETSSAALGRFSEAIGQDYDWANATLAIIGAQRCLRILGVFARLSRRDQKPGYLKYVPRVWDQLGRCLKHPDLKQLATFCNATLPSPDDAHLARLGQ